MAKTSAANGEQRLADRLRQGMTQEQVREALGEPAEIRPVKSPAGQAERWIYRRRVNEVVEQRATGTQEVPYIDPISGQMRTIPEPVYSQVRTTITEELHVLLLDGRLIDSRTRLLSDRTYVN